eukprot:Skav231949  [mRNA]  locus=scaffold459:172376:173644:+ [translate_table: standard]
MFVEKYKSIQAEKLARFEDAIKKDTKISNALAALNSGGNATSTNANPSRPTPAPSRTLASPQRDGEVPVNFRQRLSLNAITIGDFDSHRLRCRFESPAATLANAPEHLPWSVNDDKQIICLVKPADSSKQLMTIADVMCSITKERGAESDGTQTPLSYRYLVSPDTNIHCYKPKELATDVDRKACRSTQLGAFWCGRFQKLPRSAHCGVVWEVPWIYHSNEFAHVC